VNSTPETYDLERLQALDQDEWARLQRDYYDRVYYYCKRQLRDPTAAEDVTSETFLGALKGIDRFDSQYNIEQFLFGIARKKIIDSLRRGGHEVKISEDEDSSSFFGNVPASTPTPSSLSAAREKIRRQRAALVVILREWVAALWEAQDFKRLKAIELIFLSNWKHRRISDYLGYIDEKAVAGVKFRAIREFQDALRLRDPNRTLFSRLWE
jgi:RNA polymerase sigma factor (sigma-70 family)